MKHNVLQKEKLSLSSVATVLKPQCWSRCLQILAPSIPFNMSLGNLLNMIDDRLIFFKAIDFSYYCLQFHAPSLCNVTVPLLSSSGRIYISSFFECGPVMWLALSQKWHLCNFQSWVLRGFEASALILLECGAST